MSEREVRYCTTEDGVSIAYCVEGEGPPLVACQDFVASFSVMHYLPEVEAFWRRVAQQHRVIWFDWRGTGLSQRASDRFTIDAHCLDIDAVVSALHVRKFALWANGPRTPIALTYAATRASHVSRLIAYGPTARITEVMSSDAVKAYAALWRTSPAVAAQTFGDLSLRRQYPAAGEQIARMYFESITSEAAALLTEASAEPDWDAGPYLSRIVAPTLVMHRRGDTVFPASAAQEIASRVKGARFLQLEGEVHYHALGESAAVLDGMLAFLAEDGRKQRPRKAAAPESARAQTGGLRTVLFTDVVGHTEMMQRLGDAKGRDVLREHERITREALKQHGGAEVKTMGDGFIASFGSVTSAMDCAIALQRAFAAQRALMLEALYVRVGLNAGEPIEEDGDLFGSTVILASRIAAKAGAGEILIPETVRHLLSGKTFVFADRGEFEMKGFDDAVRLYEVRWRE